MRQSHGDRTMTVRQHCDVSVFESASVSFSCCILFYTFEVPSGSIKIVVVHVWYTNVKPKIHDDTRLAISVEILCAAAEMAQ